MKTAMERVLELENDKDCLLNALEWLENYFRVNIDGGGNHACPWCYHRKDEQQPWSEVSHTPDCIIGKALEPSPAPQPDTQDEKLSPTPLEDCNWLCEGCGWTGVELTYVDVEDAHKRFHSKQGTRCKHGGLKLRITWPLSESSAPVVKESSMSEVHVKEERKRRVYYQEIVYHLCNILDRVTGRSVSNGTGIVCGTKDEPSTQLQDVLTQVLAGQSKALDDSSQIWAQEIVDKDIENEKLQSQISTLTAERDALIGKGWVKCSERMPGRTEEVLLYCPDVDPPVLFQAYYFESGKWNCSLDGKWTKEFNPTHWMPLPLAPAKDGNK